MRRDPDVLVIGGGIAGLFCAYYLRLAGRSVVVADRGSVGGPQASSYGNTGFVGTQGATPFAGPFDAIASQDDELRTWLSHFDRAREANAAARFAALHELKRRSLEILRTLCAAGGLASHFTPTGVVLACKTPQGLAKVNGSGVSLQALSAEELRALEPDVAFDVHGALYNEDAGFVHAPGFVREFAAVLRGLGVEIWEHAEVAGFETAGGEVTTVRTARGDVRPHETVIAAGAWSAMCARLLGLDLALQPVKGYSVTVKTPQHAPRRAVLLSEGHVAVAPLGDRLRFAGYMELAGWDVSVSPRGVDHILETVRSYLPGLETTEVVEVWAGLRPSTPDGLPFLGRAPGYRNVTFACGHGHIGMGIAAAGGELIAQLLAGHRPDMELTPFAVDRFPRSE
jgi:D-amino-acid dehydrogenase